MKPEGKAVLISIRPNWCKFIWAGMKTVEVRKTRPTLETPFKAYIYCTGHDGWVIKSPKAGVQKMDSRVIGEFTCKKIDRLTHVGAMGRNEPAKLYIETPGLEYEYADELLRAACLTEAEAEKYLKGRDGYGWHISDLKIYDKPLPLSNFIPNCRHLEVEAGCRAYREHGWSCPDQRYDLNPDGSVNMAICQRIVKRPPQSWCYVEEKDIVDLLLYSNELEKQR